MNSTENEQMVPVTARTEYLTDGHRTATAASGVALIAGLIALVALNYAGAAAFLTAVVSVLLIGGALGGAAYGRLRKPGAVSITVDADTVYFGDETRGIVSRPLASLTAVREDGPADETTPETQRLTVRGQKYLTLCFATDNGAEEWRVAVVESDPAAAEVLERLRTPLPVADSVAGARIADAGTDEAAKRLWEEAARRHGDILGAYGAYELDPAMMFRYPAITDVTVDATLTFHVALDEAAALRTEAYPGNRGLADAYQQAVVALRRAWIACETHGKRVGTGYLEPSDQSELDTALKLYRHATSSTTAAEQATYYGRVRAIVTKLVDRGVLHPPKGQLAQLEGATRRAIEAARTH